MKTGWSSLLFCLGIAVPAASHVDDRLVFYVVVGLNQLLNGQNGLCASRIFDISLPTGFHLEDNDVSPAQRAVKPYQDRLLTACSRQYILGSGPPVVVWNVQHTVEDIKRLHARMCKNEQAIVDL